MKRKIFFFAVLIFLFWGISVFAVGSVNAGFVKGIWFSKSPFFAGDQVRIYAAVQNRSGSDIIGQVEFYDNSQLIGKADFSALDGRLIEVWADWIAVEGKHTIQAEIVKARKSEPGGKREAINLGSAFSSETVVFVDQDTDRDGIGNREDPDDDNDGLPDAMDPEPLQKNALEQTKQEQGFLDQARNASTAVSQSRSGEIKNKISRIYQKTKEKALPASKRIISRVNDFIDQEAKKLQKKTEETKRELEDLKKQESGKSRLSKNIQFYTLSFVSFFFSHKALFFLAIIIFLYWGIRFLFRKL